MRRVLSPDECGTCRGRRGALCDLCGNGLAPKDTNVQRTIARAVEKLEEAEAAEWGDDFEVLAREALAILRGAV